MVDTGLLLRARDLRFGYNGAPLLAGVDLDLYRGEILLIEGENGSGKSTLFHLLSGYLLPHAGSIEIIGDTHNGRFNFGSGWLQRLGLCRAGRLVPEQMARLGVSRAWQDTRLFASMDLKENLAFAQTPATEEAAWRALLQPCLSGRRDAACLEAAAAQLRALDLGERLPAAAERVSLGQRKRVGIARALLTGARILLLDEPLAGLDRSAIEQVLELLEGARQQAAVVVVEHHFNASWLGGLCTRRLHLEHGRLHEGPLPASPSTLPLQDWLDNFHALGWRHSQQPLERGASLVLLRAPGGPSTTSPLLETCGLKVAWDPRAIVGTPSGMELALGPGELGLLLAPNGWGKTTLLHSLAGLIPTVAGGIFLGGAPSPTGGHEGAIARAARRGLGYLRAGGWRWPQTSLQASFAMAGVGLPPALWPYRHRSWQELSGGERLRASWALVLGRPGLRALLLDEPFSGLDPGAVAAFNEDLTAFIQGGGCALVALPDLLAPSSANNPSSHYLKENP